MDQLPLLSAQTLKVVGRRARKLAPTAACREFSRMPLNFLDSLPLASSELDFGALRANVLGKTS